MMGIGVAVVGTGGAGPVSVGFFSFLVSISRFILSLGSN